jgi:hypothetical protein
MQLGWRKAISKPTWYMSVIPELELLMELIRNEPSAKQECWKATLYDFFELYLSSDEIALGSGAGQFDQARMPINKIVIHHTSNPPGMSSHRLSAIELLRLYAPYFLHSQDQDDHRLKGRPVFSGHVREGRQVFWPYHWLVRKNGAADRLLLDSEIGWHAGDWQVNCRSVAIALDDDFERRRPSDRELAAIARIIRTYYPRVPANQIVGHREVNAKTTCPSELFLANVKRLGWKNDLLALLGATECAA